MLDALMFAATRPSCQTGDITRTDPVSAAPSGGRSATATVPASSTQTFRDIAHTGSARHLQADQIVRTTEPIQFDLLAAAVLFGSSAGETIRPTLDAEKRSATTVSSQTTAAQGTGWGKAASDFAKGVVEGAWDGGDSTVQGVADLVKVSYRFATDAKVRATTLDSVAKRTVDAAQFARAGATDPVKAAAQVGTAAHLGWNHVLSTYGQAAASGHGAEFIGEAVGQGSVLAAALLIPGGAEADGVAEVGSVARAATAAGDFGLESDALKIASGHAWQKHRTEFPGWNQSDFTKAVQATVQNPDGDKTLSRGRTAYWNEQEKMVVIRDPQNPDGGTAFRPKSGKSYFDLGLK